MNDLLDVLGSDQVAALLTMPERSGVTSRWPEWVPARVAAGLAACGLAQPWEHQVEAAGHIWHGTHTVVATGTGSGKSLAAWVPALSFIAAGHGPRADSSAEPKTAAQVLTTHTRAPGRAGAGRGAPSVLYLSPTKALAADQFASLTPIVRAIDPRVGVAIADGDAPRELRAWAREQASVVMSNPDFLHHVMLPGHQRWARFFRGLSMIVVDEFHSYRGTFGAHVASTIRRAQRVARHYGSEPVVVFLSATTSSPEEAAQRFLGPLAGPIAAVSTDASPQGSRTIALWRCRPIDVGGAGVTENSSGGARHADGSEHRTHGADPDESGLPEVRRAANTEAGELLGTLACHGARTLAFVRSRPGAERVAQIARDWAEEHGGDATRIGTYRGGYLPEERRDIEQRLRSGELLGLASTNALELGIDISGLDAVIVTGWPGTHASFSQQIGRAGRSGHDGLAVFVGRDNPLDQYLVEHPEVLMLPPKEAQTFDPSNPYVLVGHLCAAAAELPLTEADAALFGLPDVAMFENLAADGLLRRRPTGWFWNPAMGAAPHDTLSLRGDGTNVSIVDSETGALLGTVDPARADTTVYPGAIYLHQGVSYMVESCDGEVALVHLHREEDIRTFAHERSSVAIMDTAEEIRTSCGMWARGSVVVSSQVVGYDVRRASDGMYLGRVPLDMPERSLDTAGTWWTISPQAIREAGITAAELPGALHAAEHTMIAMLPLLATCDRWDIGGLSTAIHADTGSATVIIHDAIPGGSGCSLRGFAQRLEWVEATLETLLTCPCSAGCPRCVQSPKCGNNNEPLSKSGAIAILGALRRSLVGTDGVPIHGR